MAFLIYFPFADRMGAFAFDVRRCFHRFTLHAAIFPGHSRARAVWMSTLLCLLICHLSLLRPDHLSRPLLAERLPNSVLFESLILVKIEVFAIRVCSKQRSLGHVCKQAGPGFETRHLS